MIFNFHLYGFLIGLGILASAAASAWLARRRGLDPNLIWNGLWWVLVPALIAARLYHVADRWGDIYRLDPISTLYIWNGGLGIFGGLLGGVTGLLLYYKFIIHNSSFIITAKSLADLAVFGLPLGQTIGRLGNWVNQEVFGPPTNLPWGIYINPENRLPQYANNSTFHPLFAYEALWNLLGFALMVISELLRHSEVASGDRRIPPGSFTAFYLIWYGLGRFALDFLRPPEFSWTFTNLNLGQLSSLILIVAGILIRLKSPLISPKH